MGRVFFYLINVVDKNSFELIFEKKKKGLKKINEKIKDINFWDCLQEVGFLTFDSNIEIYKTHFHSPDFQTYTPLFQ